MVVVTPYGRAAGSSRVRVYQWLDRLAQPPRVANYLGASSAAGLARRPLAVLRAEWRLRALRPARVLLHREASPLSRGGLERRLLRSAAFGAYDFDDALQWDTRRRLFSKVATCEGAVAQADRVIAGNDVLAEWARARARDVVVIPSCVEPGEYRPKQTYALADPPRLVWIGSPATEQYLEFVREPLLALNRSLGVRLTVLSRGDAPLGGLDAIADRVTWTPDGFAAVLASADIGIGPLEDTPYSRGKCAYKLLQYGATGLPTIATPVGANRLALQRLGGVAATSTTDWYEGIEALLTAPDRAAIGARALTEVVAHYSYAAWEQAWRGAVGLP
jgi:glycosyltransferase involved in cell wall biosynthesis